MSVEDAKELYKAIGEDESLRSELKGLESRDEVIEKILEVGETRGIDVGRSDVEELMEELADQAGELDEEELENVAGGRNPVYEFY